MRRRADRAVSGRTLVLFAAATTLAWVLLLFGGDLLPSVPPLCTSRLIATLPGAAEWAYGFSWVSPAHLAASWSVMLIAMMLPSVVGPVDHVCARSFVHQRAAGSVGFIAGYLAVWLAAGVPLIGLALVLQFLSDPSWADFAVAVGLALAWQVTAWKQVALNRCHSRPPSAAYGKNPFVAWVGFGCSHGCWCVANCAPIMLGVLLAPVPSQVAMPMVALWIWAERLELPRPPAFGLSIPKRALRALYCRALRYGKPGEPRWPRTVGQWPGQGRPWLS